MAAEIASRELRNDVSAVLRRVEAGESLVVNVSGRPVALLTPMPARPQTIPTPVLFDLLRRGAADPGLANDLATILTGTTDDF